MKNKTMLKLVAVLMVGALAFTGCSGSSSVTKDSTQSTAQATNGTSKDSVKVTKETKKSSGNSEKSTEKKTDAATQSSSSGQNILDTIKTDATSGKVINCDYQANESVALSDIETAWGKPDAAAQWIADASGFYETFSAKKVTFGANKGEAVFEIRSFDDSIKSITLGDLQAKYGTPDYTATTGKEKIVGYVVNSDYKLLFVFPQKSGDESTWTLDHYSVFYPAGTVNSMAGDSGRKW